MTTNFGGLNGSCAVCHRVLDWETDFDGTNGHWVHTTQDRAREDHAPVWESEGPTTEYRCDFCNLNGPTFILPCSDFPIPGSGRIARSHSIGEWLACGDCAPLISTSDWPALIERVLTASPSLSVGIAIGELRRSETRQWLTVMYRELRQHILGPLQPWAP